jgi:two-component sensor histidine kinase/CheY-like chemotaxis protein
MWERDGPVLILAPIGRDGEVAASILQEVGALTVLCPNLPSLVLGLDRACCAVVTEEALLSSDRRALAEWIKRQPPWSDLPFILLTYRGAEPNAHITEMLGNVTALERPFHPTTLVNAVRSAARARRRQREVESYLEERQRTEERQSLLIRELHHRVKNTLATVQGLLGATARSTTSVDEFYHSFANRIVSLAKTHTLLTEDYWQTASLHEMLRNELGPYNDDHGQRIVLTGPPVELSADLAVPTGMALHELTTNAAKHGALSVPGGRVLVTWDVARPDQRKILHLAWVERGGPPVETPTRTGFGSVLLKRVLTTQCHAEIRFDFDRDGLRFEMEAPLIEHRHVPSY